MKKVDLKTILTITTIVALILFCAYILWKIEVDKDIALLFFGAFIALINQITNYFYTRKSADSEHKKETETK